MAEISKIKVGGTVYTIKDAAAQTSITNINQTIETLATDAALKKAKEDLQKAIDDLSEELTGADATTVATLEQIKKELSDPSNAGGLLNTFLDKVKALLAGLEEGTTIKEAIDAAIEELEGKVDGLTGGDIPMSDSDDTTIEDKIKEIESAIGIGAQGAQGAQGSLMDRVDAVEKKLVEKTVTDTQTTASVADETLTIETTTKSTKVWGPQGA